MQIKTKIKYHFTLIKMVIIKKTENYKGWQGCEGIKSLSLFLQTLTLALYSTFCATQWWYLWIDSMISSPELSIVLSLIYYDFKTFDIFFKKNKILIYFWLHWVFVAARGLFLVAASGAYCSLWCSGSCCRARALGTWASVVVVHGLSCSVACGIFLDQGSNLCPLVGRQILNHCTTREVPDIHFKRIIPINGIDW